MANEKKRNAGDVLLELLEFVTDADALERMLEPENLLRILTAQGRSKEEIRAELDRRLPGELLLDVLRGGGRAEDLLALCAPPGPGRKRPPPKSRAMGDVASVYAPPAEAPPPEPQYPLTTPFQETGTLNKVSGWIFSIAVIIPAMIVSDFFADLAVITPAATIVTSSLVAVMAGVGFVHKRAPAYVGALGGLLIAPPSLLGIAWWTAGRHKVWNVEIAIAFLIGAMPGALVYMWLFNRVVRKNGA